MDKKIFAVLLGGVMAISTSAVLTRLAQAPPAVAALYRLFFATLLLAPLGWKQRKEQQLTWKQLGLSFVAGAFLALHFLLWMTSLEHTSVTSSVVLVTTQPLFVFLISVFFFAEKPSKMMWLGLAMALAGSITVVFSQGDGGEVRLFGNLLALGGAVMMACYFLVGRQLRQELPLALYSSLVYGASSLVLVVFILLTGQPLFGFSTQTWLTFFSLALVPTILGHNGLNWALKYLPATMVSVSILGEPLGATLLAAFVLGEFPTALEIVGSLLTLGGIVLVWWVNLQQESIEKAVDKR